ncbi:MAG: hypothetical protein V3T25_01980 [Gemmatimonadota bacterium]
MIGYMRLLVALVSCSLVLPRFIHAQEVAYADRVRIAEAFRLADEVEQLWPGWSEVPFAVLLVTSEHEFLIRHPHPSDDFESLGRDALLDEEVLVRPRVFEPGLLATFPAVSGLPTLVIGTPEETGLSSTQWVLTALHEHFHQLQMSDADYYPATNELELSGGDESGMWMLDYPFPYDSPKVAAALEKLARAARLALDSIGSPSSSEILGDYLAQRDRLQEALTEKEYRYLSFQIWQEGMARYTQLVVAARAGTEYVPSEQFEALPDFMPYSDAAEELRETVRSELERGLPELRRVFFYPIGAVEGLLLDEFRPGWREYYLARKFYVERYFADQ